MPKRLAGILLILLTLLARPAAAQSGRGPIYTVRQGDTLWSIAVCFNITTEALIAANDLNTSDIFVGDRLVIPGYEAFSGTISCDPLPYGETLRSLVRQHRMDETLLRRLNHIVSPTELYAGAKLILLQDETRPPWTGRANLQRGETLLELAVRANTDPWTIADINHLAGPWAGLPGDIFYLPSGDSTGFPSALPAPLLSAEVDPLPLVQGSTAQIRVRASEAVTLGGILVDHPLHFFPDQDGSYVALQGIHALLQPGLYPLRLEVASADGQTQTFEQLVLVASGYYPEDPTLYVDADTIDPTVTEPEWQQILAITAPANPQRLWDGLFLTPAYLYGGETYFTSGFGNRRTYIGQGTDLVVEGFHSGVDYGGGAGLPITAPAAGTVVFAGPLTVRGNATIIDHGWGVYSGFWHQSEIQVEVGQHVEQGQVIGLVGGTGRVTGAHLHWEVWVNGVQVNPLDWLQKVFPHE
ncbi:MAG: peptidoglycan DD-metalloendopeptidase family protein [Anaerolineales bacterium]